MAEMSDFVVKIFLLKIFIEDFLATYLLKIILTNIVECSNEPL